MKGKLFSIDIVSALLIILLLGGVILGVQKSQEKSRVKKYIRSQPEVSEIQREAMGSGIIIRGMTKSQVETMKGKGKLTQIEGYPTYLYSKQVFSYHEDWYVIYNNSKVIWSRLIKYDTYLEHLEKKKKMRVTFDMTDPNTLIFLERFKQTR